MRGGDPSTGVSVLSANLLFPACAGVIPNSAVLPHAVQSFPRMRGGDPLIGQLNASAEAFSPHARG